MDDFDRFWQRTLELKFPRPVAKHDARKAWNKLKPDANLTIIILAAQEAQTQARQEKIARREWVPEAPYAASWVRGMRWEDECEAPAQRMTMATQREAQEFKEHIQRKRDERAQREREQQP